MQLKNDKRDEKENSDEGRFIFLKVIQIILMKRNIMNYKMRIKMLLTILKKSLKKV
jgi:hypothetical protein